VASTTLVDKLKLKIEPHPHPYLIQWLNHGKGLRVSSRCLIALSIGRNYVDELWCDIRPVDACHVLLGTPWLFDRRVVHDGHQNTYTFHKDGRKITLAPLAPHQIPKPKSKENPKEGEIFLSLLEATLLATHQRDDPSYPLTSNPNRNPLTTLGYPTSWDLYPYFPGGAFIQPTPTKSNTTSH